MNRIHGAVPLAVLSLLFALAARPGIAAAETPSAAMHAAAGDSMTHAVLTNLRDLKWNRIFPDAGEKSAEISILHEDPVTHATQLLQQGVPPKIVSERLGHSSVAITLDTYSHVLPGMQESAAQKVFAVWRAAIVNERARKPS